MNTNIDQPRTQITTKLIDLIKEKIWLIVGSLFSSSIIAYISSRLFIKTYLNEIGYPSLTYSALLDNSTVSVLTFGILTVFIGFLFSFCLFPIVSRLLYAEKLELYKQIHEKFYKGICAFLCICLSLPLLILIPDGYVPSLLYWLSPLLRLLPSECIAWIDITHFMYLSFSPSLLFIFLLIMTWKKSNGEDKFKLLLNGFLFGAVTFFAFYPFLIFIQAINYLDINKWIAYSIIVVIWLGYSFFNGVRIISNEKVQYLIDITLAVLFIIEIIILSSNTVKVPIAEFVGIKDKGAKIYQISQSDYDELNQEIKQFWQLGNICSNNDESCQMLVANYDNTCNEECLNPVYLHAQIIFRDNKNSIICPPNYNFGKNMNDRCLLIAQNKLTPTSQTEESLKKNTNIVVDSFTLSDK